MIHLKEVSKVYTLNDPSKEEIIEVVIGTFEDEEGRTHDHALLKNRLHHFYEDKEMTIPKKLDLTIGMLAIDNRVRSSLLKD